MLSKLRDSTRAQDDEITRNLVRLARTRPDIFGSTDEEVSRAVSSSIADKQTTGAARAGAGEGEGAWGD
jgi:splicing factor 3A subunit 1